MLEFSCIFIKSRAIGRMSCCKVHQRSVMHRFDSLTSVTFTAHDAFGSCALQLQNPVSDKLS